MNLLSINTSLPEYALTQQELTENILGIKGSRNTMIRKKDN